MRLFEYGDGGGLYLMWLPDGSRFAGYKSKVYENGWGLSQFGFWWFHFFWDIGRKAT